MAGGSSPYTGAESWLRSHWREFHSSDVSAEELNASITESEGTVLLVTEFASPFELRKLQIRWQRTPPGGVIEDVDVATFHFLKLDGAGNPTITWVDADYTALETALDTWWTALKPAFYSTIALGQYRWYASGPDWDVTPAPYNPARRITERNVAGTDATGSFPPQVAMSVTEKTASRPTWGRFYLPAPGQNINAVEGLIATATVDTIVAATVAMYNTARAANKIPVVFTRARGEYTRKDGTVLPPKAASAHSVDSIQMDNVFDVIRSRRWETVTYRKVTALT